MPTANGVGEGEMLLCLQLRVATGIARRCAVLPTAVQPAAHIGGSGHVCTNVCVQVAGAPSRRELNPKPRTLNPKP